MIVLNAVLYGVALFCMTICFALLYIAIFEMKDNLGKEDLQCYVFIFAITAIWIAGLTLFFYMLISDGAIGMMFS